MRVCSVRNALRLRHSSPLQWAPSRLPWGIHSTPLRRFHKEDVPLVRSGEVGAWVSDLFAFRRSAVLFDALRYVARLFGKDFTRHEDGAVEEMRAMLSKSGVQPTHIFPHFKEGGAFVYFENLQQASTAMGAFKKESFRGARRHVYLVEGEPWLEDMLMNKPTRALRISPAEGDALKGVSKEALYAELRVYGRLTRLDMSYPKRADAVAIFESMSCAISARNCLHMKKLGDTQIRLEYESVPMFPWLKNLLSNPRIMVPLGTLLAGVSSFLLIDPLRTFLVGTSLTAYQTYPEADREVPETEDLENLRSILVSPPHGASLVITGAPESLRLALQKLIHYRFFVVQIPLNKADDPHEFVEDLSHSIGFWPSFGKLAKAFAYMESLIPGAKTKDAVSTREEEQLERILKTLSTSLMILSRTYPSENRAFPYAMVVLDMTHGKALNEKLAPILNAWIKKVEEKRWAHIVILSDSAFSQWDSSTRSLQSTHFNPIPLHDLDKPTVQGLLARFFDEEEEEEEAWLDSSTSSLTSRVVEILEHLILAEGRRLMERMRGAKSGRYREPLDVPLDNLTLDALTDHVYNVLGGRLGDVLDYVEKVEATRDHPLNVLQQMVNMARAEVQNDGFGRKLFGGSPPNGSWSQSQLWKCMLLITGAGDFKVSGEELVEKVFKGDLQALRDLMDAGILAVTDEDEEKADLVHAGNFQVTAGSPLYLHAFKIMVADKSFYRAMSKYVLDSSYKDLVDKAQVLEADLERLSRLKVSEADKEGLQGVLMRKTQLAEQLGEIAQDIETVREKTREL